MSRQWRRGCWRGLGEDQGPVTLPLHAVTLLSAVGLWLRVSLEEKNKGPEQQHKLLLTGHVLTSCSLVYTKTDINAFCCIGNIALTFVFVLFAM